MWNLNEDTCNKPENKFVNEILQQANTFNSYNFKAMLHTDRCTYLYYIFMKLLSMNREAFSMETTSNTTL